jgi:hypothetical protein
VWDVACKVPYLRVSSTPLLCLLFTDN